jgi:hypothetical protein
MSTLLEKALEKVVGLPQNEQGAIASEILASLAGRRRLEETLCGEERRYPPDGARSPRGRRER